MNGGSLPPRRRPALRPAGLLLVATAVAATAAYQVMRPVVVDLGSALAVPLSTRGFYPAEEGYRWTNGQGEIALPSPGRGRAVRLEMFVSAWRPRGTPAPQLRITAEGASVVAEPGPAPVALTLLATTAPSTRSGMVVHVDSESFTPGRGDPRTLGVRVHQVRLSPAGGVLQPGLPPLWPVLWALAAVQLLFWIGVRIAGGPDARVFRAGLLAAALVSIGLAFARAWTVWLLPAATVSEGVLLLVVAVAPQHARKVAGVIVDAARRLLDAGRAFEPRPLAAIVVLGIAGTLLAYWTQPVVVIPMGSGRETAFEAGLGAFDARDGVRFRHVGARAALDLGDLGGGTWRASVTAAAPGAPRPLPLVDAGAGVEDALLGPEWSTHEIVARAPSGWRSGMTLAFPGSRRDDVWLREVRIDRGRAWPSLRIVTCVIAAGLLLALALRVCGLGGRAAWAGAATFVVLEAAAIAADPAAALPHAPHLVAIVLLGAIVTALARSILVVLPPAAVAAGGVGFMAWLAATTAPLYRGGHFVFHSSIAEEIWKGRFLLYYLPYPGSMLSQQAQWGNVIVPHPALYHTLAAPLAALPHAAFFVAEKVLLALLLAGMAWASAALAGRIGPPGATEAAAILMAAMPASFQLLGLGHLMTILGCWAMTMAVAYLALSWDHLGERRRWWRAVLLLALCYLSYFAGLLFMLMVIAIAAAALIRSQPAFVRALLSAGAMAAALAFAAYYVNWTWPFLSESVPQLLGGSGAQSSSNAGALPLRIAAAPHKLAYTFGSVLVPLLGIAGLVIARRGVERVLLLAWATVLPVFTGLDLFFNFLLKHHYFTMVPVAVGGGVLLARVAQRGRGGRALAVAALVIMAVLAARVGLDAATGRIP